MQNKIRSLVFKQYRTGMWLGGLQSQFYSTQGIIGGVQFLIILLMAYQNNLKPLINQWMPWMNTFWFILLGIAGIMVLMMLDFKAILPSRMEYGNAQAAKHKNPIMDELAILKHGQEDIKAEIKSMKELRMDNRDKIAEVVWKLWDNGGEPKGKFEDSDVFKNKYGFPYTIADAIMTIGR